MPHDRIHKLLHHFQHEHLPEGEQTIAFHSAELARTMVDALATTRDGAALAVGLQRLIEANDWFLRASRAMPADPASAPSGPPSLSERVRAGLRACRPARHQDDGGRA